LIDEMADDATGGRLPCVFVNHGGGPLPLIGQQPEVADLMSSYPKSLKQAPTKILVVSAHWETERPIVSSGSRHSLLFDYNGFPPETYHLSYEAPGDPELAQRVQELLTEAGSGCDADDERGWDHGVFVPLMLMFPEANIPVVSLSVLASQSADEQMKIGEALQPLRDEGVLIVGSGMSFHNFKHFYQKGPEIKVGLDHSVVWDKWLQDVMTDDDIDADTRRARLTAWDEAPSAREAHPVGAAEHLMPLFAVVGAGGAGQARRIGWAYSPSEFAISGFDFN